MERITGTVVGHRTESESEIVEALLADVEKFSSANRRDNVAIVAARFL